MIKVGTDTGERLKSLCEALIEKYRDSPEDIAFMEEVFQNLLEEPISTW